jgi:hypothetical protein
VGVVLSGINSATPLNASVSIRGTKNKIVLRAVELYFGFVL